MKTLVTGGTGFIGRYLLACLQSAGDDIHVLLSERPNSRLSDLPAGITGHFADLRQAAMLRRIVEQIAPQRVFHLAAVGVSDPFLDLRLALRVNLDGTLNLLRAVNGQAPIVVTRTPGELTTANIYAASKAAAWVFCQMFAHTQGWPIVGAMVFSAYGPGQNPPNILPAALQAAQAGQDFPMSAGEQLRDWIYAPDVAAGLMAVSAVATEQAGQTFDLGTGVGLPLAQVVSQVYTHVGQGGQPLVGRLPYRPGEIMYMVANAARTTQVTGWEATYNFEQGLTHWLTTLSAGSPA